MLVTVDFFPDGVFIGDMFCAYILASKTGLWMLEFTEIWSVNQSSSESIFLLFLPIIFCERDKLYLIDLFNQFSRINIKKLNTFYSSRSVSISIE